MSKDCTGIVRDRPATSGDEDSTPIRLRGPLKSQFCYIHMFFEDGPRQNTAETTGMVHR